MWLYIPLVVGFVLAIASFFIGLWPVGVILLIAIAIALATKPAGLSKSSADRAKRQERRAPSDPLPPAHEGQAHMTPDEIPAPRG